MTDNKQSPYASRVVAKNEIGVHASLGEAAQTCKVGVPRPMPCIVILVHGVNDVGEAYQNQETGIIQGLKKRLDRTDLYAHEWKDFIAMPGEDAQKKICSPGRSPVIPFYWGYKPVTRADYVADQQRYREEVRKLGDAAHLPYDAYQENDPQKMAAQGNDGQNSVKYQNDNLKNVLDVNYAKNGGTFANATTNIPDMLGPGSGGPLMGAIGFATLHMNGGDFTHPIYENPHRIYQFFAAQRLADLILQIRREPVTEKDVINVVAHSQGTIITMLANMLVKQEGSEPANCVIMNHSPYSLESRLGENTLDGHHQTDEARQKTFKNFCKLMATQYKGAQHTESEIKAIEDLIALPSPAKNQWHSDPRYSRNNNGRVYNYFCPVDGTVSLANIQGIGWRGVPQNIAKDIPNLYQRVFYQHGEVGNAPDSQPFVLPPFGKGDFDPRGISNASYTFHDVMVNAEELPEPFKFKLQGQDNHPDDDPKTADVPYKSHVDPDSPDHAISYSAKAGIISRTITKTYSVSSRSSYSWTPGHVLTKEELLMQSYERDVTVIKGVVTGSKEFRNLQITWLKSREELEKEWQKTDPVGYSQHSSIVMSEFAPSHAMAFDLAIGQCKAFDYQQGKFWEALLHRADWRDPLNPNPAAKKYYQAGQLPPDDTKFYMNNPDSVLPKGEFGVSNLFYNSTKVKPAHYPEIHDEEVVNLQWDMPKPLNDYQLK
ncbi:T6SS effector phospholipase Tle3 domain-containing protein [Buttiauxella brennerae]|uniref:T6SS effector phospholipase Tle3 domain-containing protein n=1 Tax=Buttiauxella brennerae TaxID=82988 RepID=UPI00286EBE5E|nr:DUF3274 domain-containing protein [Buttiauxella brennerae]